MNNINLFKNQFTILKFILELVNETANFVFGYTIAEKFRKFPDYFMFGVGTSSYQIEGAWNEDGKGENIWDEFTHRNPSPIKNGDTGDIACDSYHKYKEDIALIAGMGAHFYRFSISWTRILPTGRLDNINQKGIQYYKNVVNEILRYNMTPIVTIYHWEFPQTLAHIGWTNPDIIDIFVDYARIVIKNLPEVGIWITINEPKQICHFGYGTTTMAPGRNSSGLDEYTCGYIVLKTHAKTYRMYKEEFKNYTAMMGLVIDCQWYDPVKYTERNIEAAERLINFECGMYAHPIYVGNWPSDVRIRIYEKSMTQNYTRSRLPKLTPQEIDDIKGTSDFFGLNYYFSYLVEDSLEDSGDTLYEKDVRVDKILVPGAEIGYNGFPIVPWGLAKVLNFIKKTYQDPPIFVTEVGMADDGSTLEDNIRVNHLTGHLNSILDAIEQHDVKIMGVSAWSLLDNFEWHNGYSAHFGLFHVDFNHPNRTRTPKKSVEVYTNIIKTNSVPSYSEQTVLVHKCMFAFILIVIFFD